jgi:hypothetical protein
LPSPYRKHMMKQMPAWGPPGRGRPAGVRGGGWRPRPGVVVGRGAADLSVGSGSARAAVPGPPSGGGGRNGPSVQQRARRRSGGGRGGGWGMRLVAVTNCGAADRPIGSASAHAATPGSLAGLPLSDGVGWVKVTVCRHRYFVRRRRHVRQQDSSRDYQE